MTVAPGTKLGPYDILAELGHGGMGVVYTARDPRLDRQVAIKVLPPDLTRDDTAKQRFLQEAKAASALDHPNICNIHEINEAPDGQLYLVMAHYEGETLKERIERGALKLDEAVDIATQVGRGLAKAHAAGIVHRDIKPANLMVTSDGTVKILDFGLAKLAGAEGVTQTGTAVGTVAYMSPEQARGEEVDHRTDIWSLGVVFYEMLSGQKPFQGENLLSLADAIRSHEPAPLRGDTSSHNSIVHTALHKSPSQRYQTVADLLDDLLSATSSGPQPATQSEVASIAVLPFADMSAKKDQDYFCEGMAEEIINALTTLEGLKVASRTSAFQFKGQSHDIRRIGDALNVKTVLEGSVRTAGNRLRVTTQLINIADGYQVWSERFDRQMEDVFDIQDEISVAIAEALTSRLVGDAGTPRADRHTEDLDAYHLYLQGRHHWFSRYRGGLTKALRYFEQAVEKDPDYALAHAGAAQVYVLFGVYGFMPPKAAFPRGKAAAKRGLVAGKEVAAAHVAMGMTGFAFDWNWAESDQAFRQAIALDPDDGLVCSWHGLGLAAIGRHREAAASATHGQCLDPLSPYANSVVGTVYLLAREYQQGRDMARQVLDEDPNMVIALWSGGGCCAGLSKYDEAVAYLQTAAQLTDRLPLYVGMLGQFLARSGNRSEAEALLEELRQRSDQEYVPPVTMSWIAMALGETDRALDWLEQEHRDRGVFLFAAAVGMWFDEVRDTPRFQALLRRMNFPQTADPSA